MLVYKVTNKINNKCYIGSTYNFEKRKSQHIKASKNKAGNKTYNYPLYRAFRKYGLENFTFEILEDNIKLIDIAAKELNYIEKFNSYTNTGWGYNQTEYTDCALRDPEIKEKAVAKQRKRCAEVDEFGHILKIFKSIHECARLLFNSTEVVTNISAVCRGKKFSYLNHIIRFIDEEDNIIQTTKLQSVYKICSISIYNLKDKLYYNSISDAAEKAGIAREELSASINGNRRYSVVHERIWRKCYSDGTLIDNGISIDDLLENYYDKCAVNLQTGEKIIEKTWQLLADKVNITRKTLQKYYELNRQKNNFMFYKIDKQGNLYKKDN